MVAGSVVFSLISLFLLMAAGYILRAGGHIDRRVIKGLSAMLVLLVQPVMVIQGLQQPYSPERLFELGRMTAGFAAVSLIGAIPCLAYCLIRKMPPRDMGVWINCAAFPNCIFMARPIAVAIWGESVYFPLTGAMFCFNLLIYSMGIFLYRLGEEGKEGGMLRQALRGMVNPAMAAIALALPLFVCSIRLPEPVLYTCDMIAGLGTPIAMMIIGAQLAESGFKQLFADKNVYILSAMRLIAGPLAAWVLLRPIISDPVLYGLLILAAVMPTGATVAVFAERYDNNAPLASGAVLVSTLLSLVTIPILAALLM